MTFSDPRYLIFLFVIATALPFLRVKETRIYAIVVASFAFYAAFSPLYVVLLGLMTLWTWKAGLLLETDRLPSRRRSTTFIIALIGALSPLLCFKYCLALLAAFEQTDERWNFLHHIILPVGLSFYTFQAAGYLIDVYLDKIPPERKWQRLAAFMSFFPQLTAGPIARSTHLLPQFDNLGRITHEDVLTGFRMLLVGFFMKIVIADQLSPIVDAVYANPQHFSRLSLICITFFFPVQVYGDFAGYSLIAIGSARILGIRLMRNFNHPYFSQTLPEYWRTWHISLSSWFRDYVFTPLHFQWRTRGATGLAAALILTFTLVGIWHGANINYAIFGFIHGVLVAASTLTLKRRDKWLKRYGIPPWLITPWRIVVTFSIIMVTFILFRANSVADALYIYKTIAFGGAGTENAQYKVLGIALCILLMAGDFIAKHMQWNLEPTPGKLQRLAHHLIFFLIYLTLLYHWTDSAKEYQPFIYFKF